METTKTFKFSNGEKVKEKVTGFKGTITGTCFYLTGCNQYLITAKAKNEFTQAKAAWYDEGRIEYISKNITEKDVTGKVRGCDIPAPIK